MELFDVKEILSYQTLGQVYDQAQEAAPIESPLFQYFVGGTTPETVYTDKVNFIYLSAVRGLAQLNFRGAKARMMGGEPIKEASISMMHMFNQVTFGMDVLNMLREPDSYTLQRQGKTEIKRQTDAMVQKQQNTKSLFLHKALADGIVYVDGVGNILESSSGNLFSIDFGVPASHKTDLNFGGGATIDAYWTDASTKILTHLDNIRIQNQKEGNAPVKHIWLRNRWKTYIRNNTEIKAWIQQGGSQVKTDLLLRGETIDDLGGYTWHFYDGTYYDSTGTQQYYIPATKAIITPDKGPWFAHYQGVEPVPTQIGVVSGDVLSAVASFQDVTGDFAYAALSHNPPAVDGYMGSNFSYALKNPYSIFVPTISA